MIEIRDLGLVAYEPTYAAMQEFTSQRGLRPSEDGHNQLWICEHFPVFTQGLAGKPEHVLNASAIPVVPTNRGGQVTFHGPGQVVAYPLIDLKQAGYFVKEYVYKLEEASIRTLAHFGVTGHRVPGAPGIYVRLDDPFSHARLIGVRTQFPSELPNDENWVLTPINHRAKELEGLSLGLTFAGLGKIAALGIKVSRHFTYHGLALNVAMDLEPFSRINPCGFVGLQTVDLSTIGVSVAAPEVAQVLAKKLVAYLAA